MSESRHFRCRPGTGLVCALAAALVAGSGRADWETVPDVRMELEANDNPRLGQRADERADFVELEDETATRMLLDAGIRLRNAGPRGQIQVRPRLRLDAQADAANEDLEREDAYLHTNAVYRWPRTTTGFRLNLARESIISAELAASGLTDPDEPIEDPVETETGLLVRLDEHRNRAIFAPYAEFALSERSALLLESRHLDVSYTGPDDTGRTDFSDTSFSMGVGRTIDDRTGATARLIASRYEADATQNTTDTVGVEGTFSRELSELWSFNLATGLQRSEFIFVDDDGDPIDNATTNYTFSLVFEKRTELSSFDIGLFRLLNPNAVGFLVERNELRVRFRRQLSERLSTGIGLRAMQVGALERETSDRDYVRADVDFEWAFTPTWALSMRYGVVDQRFAGDRLDGTANVLSIGAVYRGLTRPE